MDLKGNGGLTSFGNSNFSCWFTPSFSASVCYYLLTLYRSILLSRQPFFHWQSTVCWNIYTVQAKRRKIMSPFPSPLASQSHGPADKTGKHLYCRELAAEQQSRWTAVAREGAQGVIKTSSASLLVVPIHDSSLSPATAPCRRHRHDTQSRSW